MMGRTTLRRGQNQLAIAAIGSLVLSAAALADYTPPQVTMQFYAGSDANGPYVFDLYEQSSSVANGGSNWEFSGGAQNSAWELDWSIMVNPGSSGNTASGGGPVINLANLAVTNTTGANQTFFVQVTMALSKPFTGATIVSGDVSVSIQSYVGTSATLSNVSDGQGGFHPIYQAFNGNVPTLSLMDPLLAPVTSTGFGTVSATEAGGPLMAGPAVSEISIWLRIEVTAQSIATVIGIYEVIPAPAALPLMALGVLAGRRRRRS